MNDLVKKPTGELQTVETSPGHVLAALLSDTKKLQEIPMETVNGLWEIAKDHEDRQAEKAYNAAKNAMESELEPVRKEARNIHTKSNYAKAEHVEKMLMPVLARHGFSRSVDQGESKTPGFLRFILTLRHVGGHKTEHWMDAPIDDIGMSGKVNKTKMHGVASTYNYCKRLLTCNVCGVQLTEDDDGNAGSGARQDSLDTIDEKQLADLTIWVESLGDPARFCKMMGIRNLAELPKSRYQEAVDRCKRREAAKADEQSGMEFPGD